VAMDSSRRFPNKELLVRDVEIAGANGRFFEDAVTCLHSEREPVRLRRGHMCTSIAAVAGCGCGEAGWYNHTYTARVASPTS